MNDGFIVEAYRGYEIHSWADSPSDWGVCIFMCGQQVWDALSVPEAKKLIDNEMERGVSDE